MAHLADRQWRPHKHFSTVLPPLEDSAPKFANTQRQAGKDKPRANAIFEDVSEEYRQDSNAGMSSRSTLRNIPNAITTTSPVPHDIECDSAGPFLSTSTSNGLFPSLLSPPTSATLDDDPLAPSATHLAATAPQVDNTVFEPISDEYLETEDVPLEGPPLPSISAVTPRKGWLRSHRVMLHCTGLRASVEGGDYARADILRAELLAARVQIKRHPIYAHAALHMWKSGPAEGRTERFYEWFRLIPKASLGRVRRGRKAVQLARGQLFKEPNDLNTIACFGLIAARKGYANYVSLDTVTHIARFASPGVSAAYFDDLEHAAVKFYERFGKSTVESSGFSRWDAEKWHNMFIRALCFAGYVDACVDRLSHVLQSNRELVILPFTWVVLLEMLVQDGRGDLVAVVRDLRATTSRVESPIDNAVRPDPPSASYLARMIDSYIESGRSQDLDDLRRELIHSTARPDLWAMAQMQFYMDRKQYVVVLRQFTHFYSSIGVPKEAVLPYVQEDSSSLHRKYDTVHPLLPIVSPPTHARGINRWPSSHTFALVWQALVHLAEDNLPRLQNLYRLFITYIDQHRPSTSSEPPTVLQECSYPTIRFQYPPAMSPDAVHFHIFIMAFARLAGVDAAIKVVFDMQARDILPDLHNWTALAGHYAEQDDAKRAEKILTRMESTLADVRAAPAQSPEANHKNRTRQGPVSRGAGWIPEPNLVTYTTILRGLVDRGNLQEAKQLAARMEAVGYVPGTDERTDMVLELLCKRASSSRVSWQSRAQ